MIKPGWRMDHLIILKEDKNIFNLFFQAWNWAIFCLYGISVIVAILLVARDARDRGYKRLARVGWCALVIFVFPIGLALYLLLVKKDFQRWHPD
jgi:hypothetical protein